MKKIDWNSNKWNWTIAIVNAAIGLLDLYHGMKKPTPSLMLFSCACVMFFASGFSVGSAVWRKQMDEWKDLFYSAHNLNKELLDEKVKAMDVIQNLAPCDECADGTVHTRLSDYVRVHGTSRIRAEAVRRGGYDC